MNPGPLRVFCILLLLQLRTAQTQSYLCYDTAEYCTASATCQTDATCNSVCNTTTYRCSAATLNCTATNSTPYCNAGTGCVQCLTSSQCTNSSFPYCQNNQCVQCTATSQCISKGDCGATCNEGVCVPSNNNAYNCSNYTYGTCYLAAGNTYACSGECYSTTPVSQDCLALYGNRSYCLLNGSYYNCFACQTAADCATNQDCQATCVNGFCAPSGISSANCTNQSLSCNTQGTPYVCGNCTSNAQCELQLSKTTAVCYSNGTFASCLECTPGGRGFEQCLNDVTCGTPSCPNGICTYANPINCTATGQVCSSTTGMTCVRCNTNADCANSSTPVCNTQSHTCVQCQQQSTCNFLCGGACNVQAGVCTGTQCESGKTCTAGICIGAFDGCTMPCTNYSLPYCDALSNTCVECLPTNPATCIATTGDCSATCTNNNVCRNGTNLTCSGGLMCNTNTGTCVECTSDTNCQNASMPYCYNNNCVQCTQSTQCITSSSCGSGAMCTGNTCVSSGCNCTNNTIAQICKTVNTARGPAYLCVQCASNADCPASAIYCSSGQCVQCETDGNCQSATNCNALCVNGQCTNASSVTNCPAATGSPNATCQITSGVGAGTCAACQAATDCSGLAATPYCIAPNCVACTADANCKNNTACNAVCVNNTCVTPATGALNCQASGKNCLTASGTCTACATNADCAAPTPYCTALGTCGACLTNAVCQNDTACNAICDVTYGQCYVPNSAPLNCSAIGWYCLPNTGMGGGPGGATTGTCQECTSNSQCQTKNASEPYCTTGGVCSACRPPGGGVTYYDCQSTTSCNSTCLRNLNTSQYYCTVGTLNCAPNNDVCDVEASICVQCLTDSECPSGKVCNQDSLTCSQCNSDADCPNNASACGLVCIGGVCSKGLATVCTNGTLCNGKSCVQCLSSANCPGGQPCSPTGICGYCQTTANCKTDQTCGGYQCLNSQCQITNKSLVLNCTSSGKTCDVSTDTCISNSKSSHSQLVPGLLVLVIISCLALLF